VISSLREKENNEKKLKESIEAEEKRLAILERKKKIAIVEFQQKMKTEYPYKPISIDEKPPEVIMPEKKPVAEEKLQDKIVELIVEKVPDAY
jgi:hypothetical protein